MASRAAAFTAEAARKGLGLRGLDGILVSRIGLAITSNRATQQQVTTYIVIDYKRLGNRNRG